jgi:RimJ/RimL family protein N-acetyltransferase
MQKMLLELPTCFETGRLDLRCYQPGDGPWYYAMSQKNQDHLRRYEAENAVLTITSEVEAEVFVRSSAAAWSARDCFFLGAFDKATDEFVAQIYIGPLNWDLPEFTIGYFADKEHEGRGFVTEAVKASLMFIFEHLKAHRVGLETDDTNLRSLRVAERCGFTREGHIRQNKKNPDGTITGTFWYGVLRSEFETLDGLR